MKINLILPYPPTANDIHGRTIGAFYVKEHIKEYKQKVKIIVQKQFGKENLPLFKNYIFVKLVAYVPDRRIRDLDNIEKVLWDSLKLAKIYKDDSLIREKECKFANFTGSSLAGKVFIEMGDL